MLLCLFEGVLSWLAFDKQQKNVLSDVDTSILPRYAEDVNLFGWLSGRQLFFRSMLVCKGMKLPPAAKRPSLVTVA